MPKLAIPLTRGLAFADVAVGLRESLANSLHFSGQPVPAPHPAVGLFDPGCEMTCIDPKVRRALALTATNTVAISLPYQGPQGGEAEVFNVSLTVPNPAAPDVPFYLPWLRVAEAPIGHLGSDVLIGVDALAECKGHYDWRNGTFTLDYP